MIDWFNLASNALWILGCAIALAVLSYTSWHASLYQEKMISLLKRPGSQAALDLAGLLFSLGLGFLNSSTLTRVVYILLALGFLVLLVSALRMTRKDSTPNAH